MPDPTPEQREELRRLTREAQKPGMWVAKALRDEAAGAALPALLDALDAREREVEDLRQEREMIARCEPYRRSGACHCSTGIPGPCALEASEADRA